MADTIHRQPPSRAASLSALLARLADEFEGERVSIGDLLKALKGRSYGALVTFFGTPLVIPHIPGLSTILGLPLLFLSGQLAADRRVPYLPGFISDRSMTKADFQRTIGAMLPWLKRAEALLQPRWKPLTGRFGRRAMGVMSLILVCILILPIPFGNMLPGLAVTLFGLAILARDGLFALAGWAAALVSLVVVGGVAWAAMASLFAVWGWVAG